MDATILAASLGAGLGTGLTIMSIVSILFLPVSYAMNKLIYHSTPMRIVFGLMTFMLPILSFIIMCVSRVRQGAPTPYFGLLPTIDGTFDVGEGYFAFVFKLLNIVIHPLLNTPDPAAYTSVVESFFAPPGTPVVSEDLFKDARALGAMKEGSVWETRAKECESLAKSTFGL